MCKIAIRNAGMKQDDIARVLNVSQSVVSRPLKEHRESVSITKRKRSTLIQECKELFSPYLTGLRLFCDSWRQTSRVGCKAVSKQSPVIRNFLASVAKWRKVVAKILNMFKNFMLQNSSQNGRKVIAGVSKPSRTCRPPLAI